MRIVYTNSCIRYYNEAGKLHRTDGPATEYADGTKLWRQNGELHRLDGPAFIYPSGKGIYYENGSFTKRL